MSDYFCGFQIDPTNPPLPRAGIYRVVCLINGKPYIGLSQNIARRIEEHSKANEGTKFNQAVLKHKTENFFVEPLFYVLSEELDRVWLAQIETNAILDQDAIQNGYNIKAADCGVGPYGPAFGDTIREWHASKTQAERTAFMQPATKASVAARKRLPPEQRKDLTKAALASLTPEHHLAAAERLNAGMTPEKCHLRAVKRMALMTPERRREIALRGGETRRRNQALRLLSNV